MRYLIVALSVASSMLLPALSAQAQVSVGINAGGVSIGINMPTYPDLVQVPGYPVYYDPQANSNYFFYDGLYWVYDGDTWYDSTWYNGPWQTVDDQDVPLFVLRVPVRYYRRPPDYFRGWGEDAPPRWGDHWGNGWQSRHEGWDNWDRRSVPAPAPLPVYQRQYTGNRYPRAPQQQRTIQTQNYHYQPHEAVTRQRFQAQGTPAAQTPAKPTHSQPPQQPRLPQAQTKPAAAPHVAQPAAQAMHQPNAEPAHKGRAPVNQEHRIAPATGQVKPAQVNAQPKAHVQPAPVPTVAPDADALRAPPRNACRCFSHRPTSRSAAPDPFRPTAGSDPHARHRAAATLPPMPG